MVPELKKPAPAFEGSIIINGEIKNIKLEDYKGKYVVLFFHPVDSTSACHTEIIAFSEAYKDFQKINCELIGVSTHFDHLAWIQIPCGGLVNMNIPVLTDMSAQITKDYGVYNEETATAYRGLFIIDDKQCLRQITINDMLVLRSVEETLRLVQAFQYSDKYGEVCPAGWKPGSKAMKPDPTGAQEYFKDVN